MNKYPFNKSDLKDSSINDLILSESKNEFAIITPDSFFRIQFDSENVENLIFSELRSKKLVLNISGVVFEEKWNSKLEYQLGTRLWKSNGSSILDDNFNSSYENETYSVALEKINKLHVKEVEKLLNYIPVKYQLKVLFHKNERGVNEIYGIVSYRYEPLNQTKFRDTFIDVCNKNDIVLNLNTSCQYYHKKYESHIEIMDINLENEYNEDCKLSLIISYGKNNGHKSYSFYWLVSLLSGESVFLTFSSFNWQNNPRFVNLPDMGFDSFISDLVKEGKKIINETKNKILLFKQLNIPNGLELLDKILENIKIAYGTKERVRNEFFLLNDTETPSSWLILKSLIIYGEKAHNDTSVNMQNLIKQSHLDLLDLGFDAALEKWKKTDGIRFQFNNHIERNEWIN